MRILHVNDANGIATTIAHHAPQGYSVDVMPIERVAGRGFLRSVRQRLSDRQVVKSRLIGFDVLHVHYGLHSLWAWGGNKNVVHLHGSDLRLATGQSVMGRAIRQRMLQADAVAFSTPDLADDVLSIRPEAVYVPNPVDDAMSGPLPDDSGTGIFWFIRFDALKGVDQGLQLLDALNAHSNTRVTAIRWGDRFPDRDYITWIDPMDDRSTLRTVIDQHRLILGQMLAGALGLSELEALARGKPVVARIQDDGLELAPPVVSPQVNAVLDALAAPEATGSLSRLWAKAHHSPEATWSALQTIYQNM